MPVRNKTVSEAYCDVCGTNWSETCAICGGVFCGEHTILIEFKRKDWTLKRRLCKECLAASHRLPPQINLGMIIQGHDPRSWQEQEIPFPKLPEFIAMQTDEML